MSNTTRTNPRAMSRIQTSFLVLALGSLAVLAGILLVAPGALEAQDDAPDITPLDERPDPPDETEPTSAFSSPARTDVYEPTRMMHPAVTLRDADGNNVLETGKPVSPVQSCSGSTCHDTTFITAHGYHGAAGFQEAPLEGARPWDLSPGLYGRWDPLIYRRLSPPDDPYPDLTHAEWVMLTERHTGGGPAAMTRVPALERTRGQTQPNARTLNDPDWNWSQSGTVDLNCFLCHTPQPDNERRIHELATGRFAWAATATLANYGKDGARLVTPGVEGEPWQYNPALFNDRGEVPIEILDIRDPRDANCCLCHGEAYDMATPVRWEPGLDSWATETMGQIISPQRISASYMNIDNRAELVRPWDVHAERMVECSHCHHSGNNPAAYAEWIATRPEHLLQDARTLDIGEYLKSPSHNFAKGDSAQATVANHLDNSMRRCENCHDANAVHDWLPFTERHMQAVLCETCHIPQIYAPARRQTDWTTLTPTREPLVEYRGIDGDPNDPHSLITGYQPIVLPRPMEAGPNKLTPHNLITTWYWQLGEDENALPVRKQDLEAAFFDGEGYHEKILAAFDADGDGELTRTELRVDNGEKVVAVKNRLREVGIEEDVKIVGEIQPYSLHHNVATGKYVLRECTACHSSDSHLVTQATLSSYIPHGGEANLVGDTNVRLVGAVEVVDDALVYTPNTVETGIYLMGHDRTRIADWIGLLALLGVVLGAGGHALLRFIVASKNKRNGKEAH